MRATTRRGFLAGALASGLAPASAAQGAGPPPGGIVQARQEIVRRGRALAVTPDGSRAVVAHDRRRTVGIGAPGEGEAHAVDVGGQPLGVAVSSDGRLAAVTTASWDGPGLALVDLDELVLRARADVGPAPRAVAFAASGDRIVVGGGEDEGTVHVLDAASLEVVARQAVGLVPRGVAPDPAGDAAWIALAGAARVVRVGLADGRTAAELETPRHPDALALSPDGRRLLVTHAGIDPRNVSELEVGSGSVERHEAGRMPAGAAWAGDDRPLVAVGGAGEVLELRGGRRHAVGGAPRGLAVADGRAFTVDELTGVVRAVAL